MTQTADLAEEVVDNIYRAETTQKMNDRERTIVESLQNGISVAEISASLNITRQMAYVVIRNMISKYGYK